MRGFEGASKALRGPFKKLIAKLVLTLKKVLMKRPGKRSYPAPTAAKEAVVRDLRDPSSLHRATPEEVRRLIPDDWIERPLRKAQSLASSSRVD
ncbi:MAG: hypothetical protein ACOH16_05790 [Propionibacteriaceae bacterium]